MFELEPGTAIHIVGVAGAGMSALAKLLSESGHEVTGSDLNGGPELQSLADIGLQVWTGSDPGNVGSSEIVVASSAVPDTDPELVSAAASGIPVWRRPDLLEAMTTATPTIGATGTHGKTTSTSLMVTALRGAGHDPSFAVGGVIAEFGTSAIRGSDPLFVLEADEAFRTFEQLKLVGLQVTNVEEDHIEHFGSYDNLLDSVVEVASKVNGPVLACSDDKGSAAVASRAGAIAYGTSKEADWQLENVRTNGSTSKFTIRGTEVSVGRPGAHVALNAGGALALLGEIGYDLPDLAPGLTGYRGVHRRFETRGVVSGVTIIDDYAHHPTEVKASIDAARSGQWNRIWAVFQPHLYSRTSRFAADFARALASADRIVVTDVYGSREIPEPGVTGHLVIAELDLLNSPADYVQHRSDVAAFLATRVQEGDLVLTLGAGDITLVPDELAALLATRAAAESQR